LNQIAENLRIEAKKQTARFERIASEQEQKMKEIQDAANRLEQALTTMDVSFLFLFFIDGRMKRC
jgi:hypothetical protein